MKLQPLAFACAIFVAAPAFSAESSMEITTWRPSSRAASPTTPRVQVAEKMLCGFIGCCERRTCYSELNNADGKCYTCAYR